MHVASISWCWQRLLRSDCLFFSTCDCICMYRWPSLSNGQVAGVTDHSDADEFGISKKRRASSVPPVDTLPALTSHGSWINWLTNDPASFTAPSTLAVSLTTISLFKELLWTIVATNCDLSHSSDDAHGFIPHGIVCDWCSHSATTAWSVPCKLCYQDCPSSVRLDMLLGYVVQSEVSGALASYSHQGWSGYGTTTASPWVCGCCLVI